MEPSGLIDGAMMLSFEQAQQARQDYIDNFKFEPFVENLFKLLESGSFENRFSFSTSDVPSRFSDRLEKVIRLYSQTRGWEIISYSRGNLQDKEGFSAHLIKVTQGRSYPEHPGRPSEARDFAYRIVDYTLMELKYRIDSEGRAFVHEEFFIPKAIPHMKVGHFVKKIISDLGYSDFSTVYKPHYGFVSHMGLVVPPKFSMLKPKYAEIDPSKLKNVKISKMQTQGILEGHQISITVRI